MAIEKVVKIVIDSADAESAVGSLRTQINDIEGSDVTITIDTTDAKADIDSLKSDLNEIDSKTIKLNVDSSQAEEGVGEIKRDLNAIDKETISIDLDTDRAVSGLSSLTTASGEFASQVGLGLEAIQTSTLLSASGSLSGVKAVSQAQKKDTAASIKKRNDATKESIRLNKELEKTLEEERKKVNDLNVEYEDLSQSSSKVSIEEIKANKKAAEASIQKQKAIQGEINLNKKKQKAQEKEIKTTDEVAKSNTLLGKNLKETTKNGAELIDKVGGSGTVAWNAWDKGTEKGLKAVIKFDDALGDSVKRTIESNNSVKKFAKNGINFLTGAVKKVTIATSKFSKKGLNDLAKGLKNVANKGIAKVKSGLVQLGAVLKKLGIGLVIAAFAALADALTQNQKAVDFFKIAWGSVRIAFEDLINFVRDNFMPTMNGVKDFFANLTFASVGKAIKENLIERFNSVIEVAGHLGQVFRKLFEGDFAGAWESAKDAGVEFVDVLTGVDDTVEKVTETVTKGVDAIVEYGKATIEASKQQVVAAKAAEVAAANQGKAIAQYTRQAELLRQIRDDESKDMAERIDANNRLGIVLEKLQKTSVGLANIQLRSAQINFNLNKNEANRIALISAQTAVIQANADAEGQASEQKVNTIALLKEEADYREELTDLQNQEALDRLANYQSALNFDLARLNVRKLAIAEEIRVEKERYTTIQENDALSKEQALIAEQEHQNNLNNIYADQAQNTINIAQAVFDYESFMQKRRVQLLSEFGAFLQAAGEGVKELAIAGIIVSTIASIASIIIDTQAANAAVIAKYALVPGGPALAATEITYNDISAGIGIATATLAGAKAISQLGGSGSVSGSAPSGGTTAPPEYNIIAENEYNPIQESIASSNRRIADNTGQSVLKAYVLSKDVTSAQEFDRAVTKNSTI